MEKVIISTDLLEKIEKYKLIEKKASKEIIKIENNNDAIKAKGISEELRLAVKDLDEIRKMTIKPLNDNVKEINGKINPVIEFFKKTSSRINKEIFQYQQQEQKKADELKRKELLECSERLFKDDTPINIVTKDKPPIKITRTRKVWRVEIIGDIKDVDPEFITLSLNNEKVNESIKAGKIKIDGLKIYQEDVPVGG